MFRRRLNPKKVKLRIVLHEFHYFLDRLEEHPVKTGNHRQYQQKPHVDFNLPHRTGQVIADQENQGDETPAPKGREADRQGHAKREDYVGDSYRRQNHEQSARVAVGKQRTTFADGEDGHQPSQNQRDIKGKRHPVSPESDLEPAVKITDDDGEDPQSVRQPVMGEKQPNGAE